MDELDEFEVEVTLPRQLQFGQHLQGEGNIKLRPCSKT